MFFLSDRYRVTVIRNLPQLQKLDNVAVQADEMADAMRRGVDLVHPLDAEPSSMPVQAPPQPAYVDRGARVSETLSHARERSFLSLT